MLTARDIFEEIKKLADTDIPARGKTTADRLVAIKSKAEEGIKNWDASTAIGSISSSVSSSSDLTAQEQCHAGMEPSGVLNAPCRQKPSQSPPWQQGRPAEFLATASEKLLADTEKKCGLSPERIDDSFAATGCISGLEEVKVGKAKRRKGIMDAVMLLNNLAHLHLTLGQIGGVTERLMVGEAAYVGDGSRYFSLMARHVNLVDRSRYGIMSKEIKEDA